MNSAASHPTAAPADTPREGGARAAEGGPTGPSTPRPQGAPATVRPESGSDGPSEAGAGDRRRAYRDLDDHMIGGVASGLAAHLGLPVLWVRVAFAVFSAFGGAGIALYAALWVLLPTGHAFEHAAPGLESASRGNRRPRRARRLGDVGPVIALAAFGLGLAFAVQAVFGTGALLWPVMLGVVGVALLWRQADEAQRERWVDAGGRIDPARIVLGRGGWASYVRLGAGLLLIVGAVVLVSVQTASLSVARDVTVAVLLAVAGLAIVLGPWVYRLTRELTDERAERVRTQERADVAAHLHDSVLQTLALIQKNPADAARLARAQERDLRAWLFSGESLDDSTVASALRAAAAEIEDSYNVSVDVIAVGDVALVDPNRPIVQAAREAVTNAAKHAGTTQIDVYAELDEERAEVFVRDRGRGFDPDATPEDRYGVRHSIIDRMERHGGRAEIRSAPGEGTEVRLFLDFEREPSRSGDQQHAPHEQEESDHG